MDQSKGTTSRRSFLSKGLAVGGAGAVGTGLLNAGLLTPSLALAREMRKAKPTKGDIAILRFLSALEILETDLWQQYNELGGIQDSTPDEGDSTVTTGSGNPAYTAALQALDGDMPQYIHDNTDDEFTHFTFINSFLASVGAPQVNLDQFRTLPSSQADGAVKDATRLTNLMRLTVDTSWWTRYRSHDMNPDFGDTFPQAIPTLFGDGTAEFPAIPRNNDDLNGFDPGNPPTTPPTIPAHVQAIANTAAFHFGFIEQGGTSLYPKLAQRVTDAVVLRVLLSIGPTETMHFQVWHDKAGAAVAQPLNVTDGALVFPDLSNAGDDLRANLIMPEPTIFLSRDLKICSIIRPTNTEGAAMAAVNDLTNDGLFRGQSDEFFEVLKGLAKEADKAKRDIDK